MQSQQIILQRGAILNRAFSAALKIVEQSGDAHALEVMDFLKEHSVLAAPAADSQITRFTELLPNPLYVLVMMPEDVRLGSPWQEMLGDWGGRFEQDIPGVLLCKAALQQEFILGMTLLHEADHALGFMRLGMRNRLSMQRTIEDEIRVRKMEHRILSTFKLKKYSRVVNQLARQIAPYLASGNPIWMKSFEADPRVLDELMPREMSADEYSWADSKIRHHAIETAVDSLKLGDHERGKLHRRVLYQFYMDSPIARNNYKKTPVDPADPF